MKRKVKCTIVEGGGRGGRGAFVVLIFFSKSEAVVLRNVKNNLELANAKLCRSIWLVNITTKFQTNIYT